MENLDRVKQDMRLMRKQRAKKGSMHRAAVADKKALMIALNGN